MLWSIERFLLLRFELRQDLRSRYWSLSGREFPMEGEAVELLFIISILKIRQALPANLLRRKILQTVPGEFDAVEIR
jgi:hypothetical protein